MSKVVIRTDDVSSFFSSAKDAAQRAARITTSKQPWGKFVIIVVVEIG